MWKVSFSVIAENIGREKKTTIEEFVGEIKKYREDKKRKERKIFLEISSMGQKK